MKGISMRTVLRERLGIEVPIIQAAIANAACPALAAAVSNAGGLGMLQFGWRAPEAILEQMSSTQVLTRRPFGAGFVLDRPQEERVEAALIAGARIISLFWVIQRRMWRACTRWAVSSCTLSAALGRPGKRPRQGWTL